jgi:two-component system chemotaxis response regulator CheY
VIALDQRAIAHGETTVAPSSILLVDDDEDIRDALSELLRAEGFSVATAPNGREALSWLREQHPASCIVLLDLMMPVMDGNAFLLAKQADPALAPLPVVIISASNSRLSLDDRPGVKAVVSKPIEIPLLMAALASCE